ncbi:hypothetical protein G9A89_022455 [Geosiphon pyriformis]|nr:hypothetical protein G9A89_022455 [Geosiphon pyriformis]
MCDGTTTETQWILKGYPILEREFDVWHLRNGRIMDSRAFLRLSSLHSRDSPFAISFKKMGRQVGTRKAGLILLI